MFKKTRDLLGRINEKISDIDQRLAGERYSHGQAISHAQAIKYYVKEIRLDIAAARASVDHEAGPHGCLTEIRAELRAHTTMLGEMLAIDREAMAMMRRAEERGNPPKTPEEQVDAKIRSTYGPNATTGVAQEMGEPDADQPKSYSDARHADNADGKSKAAMPSFAERVRAHIEEGRRPPIRIFCMGFSRLWPTDKPVPPLWSAEVPEQVWITRRTLFGPAFLKVESIRQLDKGWTYASPIHAERAGTTFEGLNEIADRKEREHVTDTLQSAIVRAMDDRTLDAFIAMARDERGRRHGDH